MSKNTKQICKKLMAIATVITVLLSCIGTGYAASFTQPEVINVFTTFNGAASAQDAFYGAESPNGTMKNANAVSDETGSKISFAGETWVEYPFDEVIKTGVLHIGFDYKIGNVNDTTGLVVRGFSNMQYPDNAGYRAYNDANGNNETWLGILNISGTQSGGKVTYPSVLCENAEPSAESDNLIASETADEEWHRYDIYVSFGAMGEGQTDYFCDGEYIGTGAATDGLKSIGFKAGEGGELDNLIIKHSTTLSAMATTSKPYYGQQMDIIADYANGGVKANGGKLTLSFSEPLPVFADGAFAEEFIVKDALGAVVEGAVTDVQTEFNKITLSLDSLQNGIYTVGLSDDIEDTAYYTGMITGTYPNAMAEFVVAAEAASGKTYYMNEDFEDYTGGMPNGFVQLSDLSYKGSFSQLKANVGNASGKALTIDSNADIMYKFPQAIKDGKFTLEFDMFSDTGASWFVGLPMAHVFETNDWHRMVVSNWSGSWQAIDRADNYLIGHSTNLSTGEAATTVQYSQYKLGYPGGTLGTLNVIPNAWNNFKIDIDLTGGKAVVTLNGDTENAAAFNFGNERFTAELLGRKDENGNIGATLKDRKIMPGIGGIRLSTLRYSGSGYFDTTKVAFDNVKVYTENTYNAVNNFDTWPTDRSYKNGAWIGADNQYVPISPTPRSQSTAVYYDGQVMGKPSLWNSDITRIGRDQFLGHEQTLIVAGQTKDNVTVDGVTYNINTRGVNYYFNVPVKAGKAFDIEFDLNWNGNNASTQGNAFGMGLLTDKTQFVGTSDDKASYDENGTDALANKVLVNLHSGSKTHTSDTLSFVDGTRQPSSDAELTQAEGVTITSRIWHTCKFSYIPRNGKVYFKLTVTADADGDGTPTTVVSQEYESALTGEDDIVGIQFNHGIGHNDAGALFYLDNLKISEKISANENFVTGVYAQNFDGTSAKADKEISETAKVVEIKLAKAIENVGGVRVKVNSSYVDNAVQLSTDKKSILVSMGALTETAGGEDFALTIELPGTLESTDSYIGFFKPQTLNYNVVSGEGSFEIDGFRLYKYFAATDNSPENWYPVSTVTADGVFKLVANGYNTIDGDNIVNIIRTEENADKVIEVISAEDKAVGSGDFMLETESFTPDNNGVILKGFIWKDMKPLAERINMDVTQ